MKDTFIQWCKDHNLNYSSGYDWCDCNDFTDFVNVLYKGKWHTLYCLNKGGYRFDTTIVATIEDIEKLLSEVKE